MSRTTKPVSPRRLAANQANAARSTGPRTPAGKAASAQNARKHGFTADVFAVIRHEDPGTVDNLKADLLCDYQPVTAQEIFAVERIAFAQLALLRCAATEAGFFSAFLNTSMNRANNPYFTECDDITRDAGVTKDQIRSYCLADGFERLGTRNKGLALFLRYQAQAERLYRRAVEEFERLRALRGVIPNGELPNEPIDQPEPQVTKTDTAPQTNPSAPPMTTAAAPARPPRPAGAEPTWGSGRS